MVQTDWRIARQECALQTYAAKRNGLNEWLGRLLLNPLELITRHVFMRHRWRSDI